ncbi:MAG: CPBP family intramembrane metalloprotease [Bacilli bacterium]|nr:CPBP family intramembrane metalloprotease [Bacilli bacterium]
MKKVRKKENKFTLFLKKHFTKARRPCKNCGHDVDAYLKRCPHCYEKMGELTIPTRFQNMTFLTDYKSFLLFIIGTIGLVFVALLIGLAVNYFPIDDYLKTSLQNLIASLVILSMMACVLSYDIKDIFKSFQRTFSHLRPLIATLIAVALIIGFNYAYTAIVKACGVDLSDTENQANITAIIKNWPGVAFFFVVILGPISEELTYRVGLFTLFRKYNRYLAYVIAILIFSLAHINFFGKDVINEAISIPLYLFPAFVLTCLYEYEGVSSSTYAHILNNLISFIIVAAI